MSNAKQGQHLQHFISSINISSLSTAISKEPLVHGGYKETAMQNTCTDNENQVAFERCIDVMTRFILKYGNTVLKSNTPDEAFANQQTVS